MAHTRADLTAIWRDCVGAGSEFVGPVAPPMVSRRPLAIDLYCGLSQAKFGLSAYTAIKELVACRAEYPDHVPLAVFHHAPCALSFKAGAVRNLYNSVFAASFALSRKVRIFSLKALKTAVLIRSHGIVDFLDIRLSFMKGPALRPRNFASALLGAISLVCVGGCDREVCATLAAIAAVFSGSFVLPAPDPSSPLRTVATAPFLVWSYCLEWLGTLAAKQIIHSAGVSQ